MIEKNVIHNPFNSNTRIKKARPIETSDPAITRIYKAIICPIRISSNIENKIKLKLTDSNNNSKNKRTITKFLRFVTIPKRPVPNTI